VEPKVGINVPRVTKVSFPSSELAPPAPSPRKRVRPRPPEPKGGGQHSLAGEGAGGANSETGEKAEHSVYSVDYTLPRVTRISFLSSELAPPGPSPRKLVCPPWNQRGERVILACG
jgi:hypothetical protein